MNNIINKKIIFLSYILFYWWYSFNFKALTNSQKKVS